MAAIFNEAMLDRIDADLVLALNGDRGARQRVYQKHMKWLLHYARYTNQEIAIAMAEYEYEYGALGEDSVAEPGSPTALAEDAAIAAAEAEGENETLDGTPEGTVEDASDASEDTPETAEAEEGGAEETPEADEAE